MVDNINGIKLITGSNSIIFYPDYEDQDPIAVKDRGYYFRRNSLLQFVSNFDTDLQLTLSPVHTFALWVNPTYNEGILFSKQDLLQNILLKFATDNNGHPYL